MKSKKNKPRLKLFGSVRYSNSRKINNKNYDGNICAPAYKNKYTCFSKNALNNIAQSWNNTYPNNKIKIVSKDNKLKIWNNIDRMLKKTCNSEYCWLKQQFIDNNNKHKLRSEYFKPLMPNKWFENKNEWLNTYDIEKVMNQYMKKHKNFHFIGPVPMDFDTELGPGNCVIDELCKMDINNLIKKGKHKLGIIFNLDKHSEPGSHWVSFFADFINNKQYYFDSYGIKEPDEVTKLMNRFKEQRRILNKNMESFTNNVRHQFKGSECGVYSMHFIIKLLENNSYEDIINNVIKDDTMEENRHKYYINTKEIPL